MMGPLVRTLTAALILSGAQAFQSDAWVRADAETVRLAPDRFTELPTGVRAELKRRGCLIPQPYTAKPDRPENATRGHFSDAKELDWAVLCSRERRSSILVFRGGGLAKVDELAPESDRSKLQGIGSNQIGYSRAIAITTPDAIRRHNQRTNPPLPLLDHDGIDDAFLGKASVVWYWSGIRWLQLAGSDAPTAGPEARLRMLPGRLR